MGSDSSAAQRRNPQFWIELAFNGSAYVGWQTQPHGNTVQDKLEDSIRKLFGQSIRVEGCGRTDTGVHADIYTVSFNWQDVEPDKAQFFASRPERFWIDSLNTNLPDDIVVYRAYVRSDARQARYSAIEREYCMRAQWGAPVSLLQANSITQLDGVGDYDRMCAALRLMVGHYECEALAVQDQGVCDIRSIELRDVDSALAQQHTSGQLEMRIRADRYVRRLVRSVLGAAWAVAQGRLGVEELREAIDSQTRHIYMKVANGNGLRLTGLRYDQDWIRSNNPYTDWWRQQPWHNVQK